MNLKPNKQRPWLNLPQAPQGLAVAGFVLGLMFGPNAGYPEGDAAAPSAAASAKVESADIQATMSASADQAAEAAKKKAEDEAKKVRTSLVQEIESCESRNDVETAREKLGVNKSLFHEKDLATLESTLEKAELAAISEALDSSEDADTIRESVNALDSFHSEEACSRNKEKLTSLYHRAAGLMADSTHSMSEDEDDSFGSSEDADEISSRYQESREILQKASQLPCLTSKAKRSLREAAERKEAEECIAISSIQGDWKAAKKARSCAKKIEKRDVRNFRKDLRSAKCLSNPYNPECQMISEHYSRQKQSYTELAQNAQRMRAHELATRMAMMRGGPAPTPMAQGYQPAPQPQAGFPGYPSAPIAPMTPSYSMPYSQPSLPSVFMGY